MEEETPAHERKQREVTENQISEVSPHRLRALVRSLEHEMQTRNKPTIALLLIRRAPEQNLLVTPADTDEEKSLRRMQAAAISNVELLTTSLPCGIPNITYMHMQLTHDYDRTEVEIHQTYRHAFDIHRCMGRQRVHVRPLFVSRESEKIRDGIVTTSRRQLTTKSRLDIFDCTGVPAQEYDITLPCGIRREALPIRHNINPAGAVALRQREEQIVILRRKKALAELTRERAKADCKQRSAKSKQKQRGGGVRESMEKSKLIAHNKEKWLAMCKTQNKKQDDQEDTRDGDKAGDTQGRSDKEEGEDPGSSTMLGQRKHSSIKHNPLRTNKHHGGAMEVEREGGGGRGASPPLVGCGIELVRKGK